MMEGERTALHDLPPEVARLLGGYEGLRGYHMLPEGADAAGRAGEPVEAGRVSKAGGAGEAGEAGGRVRVHRANPMTRSREASSRTE